MKPLFHLYLTALIPFMLTLSLNVCAASPTAPYVELKGKHFDIEVAEDEASRERGLMFRDSLPKKQGMLFIFPDSEKRSFWMKNTKIALDILFFDTQRKLVNVQVAPPCRTDQCPVYPSSGAAKYVLELNAGTSADLGVKAGDELKIHR